jgi:uncharacterized damage-inducible protein DinB
MRRTFSGFGSLPGRVQYNFSKSMQPDQASFLLQTLLPKLEREHQLTRQILAAVPPEKGDYRPDAASMSAFELASHIATAELRFLDGAAAGLINFGGSGKPETVRNTADVAAWYTETFAAHMARVKQLTGEALSKMLDFRGMFQISAVDTLDLALRHSIHHRGQLSVYLRPMGAKVPSIYGESYDAAEARKAKMAADK